MLDESSVWKQFKSQKDDLFIEHTPPAGAITGYLLNCLNMFPEITDFFAFTIYGSDGIREAQRNRIFCGMGYIGEWLVLNAAFVQKRQKID